MTKVGILGMGGMGNLHAKQLLKAGYRVLATDKPENNKTLGDMYKDEPRMKILHNGSDLSREADLVFYLMEIENIPGAAADYGKYMRKGSIVSAGSSVMTHAVEAFRKSLPDNVDIANMHCLFGAKTDPKGQLGAVAKYRISDKNYELAKEIFKSVVPTLVEIPSAKIKGQFFEPYQHHDKIMADVQTGTHIAFQSIGTTWKNAGVYPWEDRTYASGIDNIKALVTMRIFSGPYHVYGGLAIYNPYARSHVDQYVRSVKEIFEMMERGERTKLGERIHEVRDFLFSGNHKMIGLDDDTMREYSLGKIPPEKKKPNSHLSQLALVDAAHKLGVNPYNNMICRTPPFTLRLGISEYLMWNEDLLEESLDAAMSDKLIDQDKRFTEEVDDWATIIRHGKIHAYQNKFNEVKPFFGNERLDESVKLSNELISRLTQRETRYPRGDADIYFSNRGSEKK